MKSTKPFRNSGKNIYSDEGKKPKKPNNNGQIKEKNHKKRFTDIEDDEDIDIDLEFKKRESIEDFFDEEEEDS